MFNKLRNNKHQNSLARLEQAKRVALATGKRITVTVLIIISSTFIKYSNAIRQLF